MAQPYVFISYSNKDKEFVDRLTAALQSQGVQTWVDRENIQAGRDWSTEIEKGLKQADALIHVASRHSGESQWMGAELGAFVAKAGKVLPLVIDDEGAAHMPLALRRIQWVDFRGEFEPALESLMEGIRYLQGSAPLAPKAAKSKGYVFISYADEDAAFVKELKGFLKKRRFAYWDFRESRRDYQADYYLELEGVIKNAAGTLSIVSPEWKQAPTALQEMHFSREVGTPVFLLKVRDPGPTLAISGMTYIDFLGKSADGFSRLDQEMQLKGL